MTQTNAYEHIISNDSSVALIDGATMKVIELFIEMTSYGWSEHAV
jgi:hypothetical protein